MTEHLRLIARQLAHLQRMREYLAYSTQRVQRILPITNWQALSLEHHEMLAAFRVRFSEFQEHLGKAMRAVAIEEEVEVERFGSVLAVMEKLGVLDSTERWKLMGLAWSFFTPHSAPARSRSPCSSISYGR